MKTLCFQGHSDKKVWTPSVSADEFYPLKNKKQKQSHDCFFHLCLQEDTSPLYFLNLPQPPPTSPLGN